ncbi:hypothetical protein Clacol_009089 [Clathrus columnatus]|uniref:Uncharacterized protein n=1 Tax=Clathrus columnatus TaxID=1419009 RepID=A0AAV5AJK0_9AGAM|nr:hypothetical protein Clacol_009089 [Clathrus columnatus]
MADDSFDQPITVEYFGSRPYDYEEILHSKPRATRRLFAGYNPSLLQEMNDAIANNWDCGICKRSLRDQWFASNLTCPRCKLPCTPSADAVPVFARDWSSPFMSTRSPSPLPPGQGLSPSDQSSSLSSRQSELDYGTNSITCEKSSGSPTPTQPTDSHSHSLFFDRSSLTISHEDYMEQKGLKNSTSNLSLPQSSRHESPHPYPHPLAVSEIVAHYGSIMLRVLGLLILLFALLR